MRLNLLSGGRPRLSGLPQQSYQFNAESAIGQPGTFAGNANGEVRTSTDGITFWYQSMVTDEIPFFGLRRIRNVIPDNPDDWSTNTFAGNGSAPVITPAFADGPNGEVNSAVRVQLTTGGTSSGDQSFIRHDGAISGILFLQSMSFWAKLNSGPTAELQIRAAESNAFVDITDEWQFINQTSVAASLDRPRGAIVARGDRVGNTTVDLLIAYNLARGPQLLPHVQSNADVAHSEDVKSDIIYNAGVAGVLVRNTTNANTVASNIVTELPGTAIVNGGCLIEPSATNLVVNNDLQDGVWTAENVGTPTDDGVVGLGLQQFTVAAVGGGVHRVFDGLGSAADHTQYWIVKELGTEFGILRSGGDTEYAAFNFQTGIVTEFANITDARITLISDAHYRVEVTDSANSNVYLALSKSGTPGSSSPAYTAAGESLLVSHQQLEATSFATSPIRVYGSPVTRTASVIDTGIVISSEFGLFLDLTLPIEIGSGNTITLIGPDATAEDVLRVDDTGAVIMSDGGTPVTIGTATLGTRIKVAYGRDATGRSASLDGAPYVTGDAPGAGHEGDTFQLGSANSVNQSRCIHHNSILYAKRPTNGQLVDLTA